MQHLSWGNYPQVNKQEFKNLPSSAMNLPSFPGKILPRGLGRSYGDSCLLSHGLLIGNLLLNHLIDFDENTGVLRCESGVTLAEILETFVPRGWFLPVTPGTKFVTVGGAIANDVHGKNHHASGNWGNHILRFELLRSTGERIICSPTENSDFFSATIGGLGLTGFITWAEIRLKKITSSWIDQEQIRFNRLDEFFQLSEDSEKDFEYNVAWVDCLGNSDQLKGIFIRGNHSAPPTNKTPLVTHRAGQFKNVPLFLPNITLNPFTINTFNWIYYHKNLRKKHRSITHYDPFFYPLDSILNWNRIYGKRGFLQYQCVVPFAQDSGQAISEIFRIIKKSNMGSFLAVLKTFGSISSPGILSFPMPGVTLALDFPYYGPTLLSMLTSCDEVVRSAHGRVYPAKDARMSRESFQAFYPQLSAFKPFIDPSFESDFWRRVL